MRRERERERTAGRSRSQRAKRAVLVLVLEAALLATACGYTAGFQPRPLPDGRPLRSVAVPIFENRSLYRELELPMTEAVVREIQRRTPLVVTSPERADLVLRGTIERYAQSALVEGRDDQVLESSISVALGVRALDRDGRVLFDYTGAQDAQGRNPTPAIAVTEQFRRVSSSDRGLARPTEQAFRDVAERVVMLLERELGRPGGEKK